MDADRDPDRVLASSIADAGKEAGAGQRLCEAKDCQRQWR